jgi:membrane protein
VGIACLLLASLVYGAVVTFASEWLSRRIAIPAATLVYADWTLSLLLTTVLFAALFKFLPDAHIAWRDVWIGAATTAVLFALGKTLLGYYFGRAAAMSMYGAAGSLVIVLLWAYYSAQIFLFGAELTQVIARQFGSGISPAAYAQTVGLTAVTPPPAPASRSRDSRKPAR